MLLQLTIGDLLSALASDLSIWTSPKMVQSIVIEHDTLVLITVIHNVWTIWPGKWTFKTLLLELILRESVNWLKRCFLASQWTSRTINCWTLVNPSLETFSAESCLTLLAFHWIQDNFYANLADEKVVEFIFLYSLTRTQL